MKDKSVKLNMELSSINQDNNDPTLLKATWLLHDFNVSGNGVILNKEVSLEASNTIKNKPIVTFYNEVSELDTPTDALGDHAEYIGLDKNGNAIQKSDTTPIGVITSNAYIMTIRNSDGVKEEVMACDSVLWLSRFQDACTLLMEWHERGIQIVSSCEYYYQNFEVKDGITHVYSPVYYDGHCILNSEERGGHKTVQPAYDKSIMLSLNELQEFNKLVSQAVVKEVNSNNESEECKDMAKEKLFKKVCELSHDDVRSQIYTSLKGEISEDLYDGIYIYDVYDGHVVLEFYNYDTNTSVMYDCIYTKTDDSVTVDLESKKEVVLKREWVSVDKVAQMEQSLNELTEKSESLEKEVSELKEIKEENKSLKSEKSELSEKIEKATETVVELNSKIKELSSYKEKYDEEVYEKSLNEKIEFYESKFKALNSISKFEDEEVQALVKKTVLDNEEGTSAIMSLNSMILDLVVADTSKDPSTAIKETCSKSKTLINVDTSFDSKYK